MIKSLRLAQGFTIVEIIVVMAVMGIFLVVGTTTYTNQVREKELKADAEMVVSEIQKVQQDVLSRNVVNDTYCDYNGSSVYFSIDSSHYEVGLHCTTYFVLERTAELSRSYFLSGTRTQLQFDEPYGLPFYATNQVILHHNNTNRCIRIEIGQYSPITVTDPYDC